LVNQEPIIDKAETVILSEAAPNIGVENFPKEGGVLLCSNHINNYDPIVVGIMAPRPVHYMAKEEIFKVPVLGNIVRKCNAFPVKRGFGDREALRSGLKVLKDGRVDAVGKLADLQQSNLEMQGLWHGEILS